MTSVLGEQTQILWNWCWFWGMNKYKDSDVIICKTVITVISFNIICYAQPEVPWPTIARLYTWAKSKLWLNTTLCCIYSDSAWTWAADYGWVKHVTVRMVSSSFHCTNLKLALITVSNSTSLVSFVHLSRLSEYFLTPREPLRSAYNCVQCGWRLSEWTWITTAGVEG